MSMRGSRVQGGDDDLQFGWCLPPSFTPRISPLIVLWNRRTLPRRRENKENEQDATGTGGLQSLKSQRFLSLTSSHPQESRLLCLNCPGPAFLFFLMLNAYFSCGSLDCLRLQTMGIHTERVRNSNSHGIIIKDCFISCCYVFKWILLSKTWHC